MSSFEHALTTYNNPSYPDPNVVPEDTSELEFHDEDEFGGDNRAYGGWVYPPYGQEYYNLVIHTLLKAGAIPAPLNIRKTYETIPDDSRLTIAYTHKNENWVPLSNHERSGPIRDFIKQIPIELLNGYWLLPVEDDHEYISWDFVFVPRNEDLVLKQLMALALG